MSAKTDIMVTQEDIESYSDKAVAGAKDIYQNDNELVDAAAEFDVTRAEESVAMSCSYRVGNMTRHRTGTADDCKEDKTEEIAASRRSHLARNRVDQVTGDTDNTFRGSNV